MGRARWMPVGEGSGQRWWRRPGGRRAALTGGLVLVVVTGLLAVVALPASAARTPWGKRGHHRPSAPTATPSVPGASQSAGGATQPAPSASAPAAPSPSGAASPSASVRPPGQATGGARSGLPWTSGMFAHRAADLTAFGTWRKRTVDIGVGALTRDGGWDGMRSQWLFDAYKNFPGQLVVSAPMWPENNGSLAACATGAYDTNWAMLGKSFIDNDRGNAILRLGWEANGDFMYWSAGEPKSGGGFTSSALGASRYRDCFRKVVAAVHTTAPKLLIDWTVNAHASPTCNGRATNCYPGDDVVDIVGIDTYDMWPVSRTQTEFDKQASQPEGITAMYTFARDHGKLFSVPEWGVAPGASGGGGFDNPFYVNAMISWFAAHAKDLAYEAYFNICHSEVDSDIYACGPVNPKAGAAYRSKLATY